MSKKKYLTGNKLVGSNPSIKRVEYDYYATPFESTENLMKKEKFTGNLWLEPCIGQGHIAKIILKYYPNIKLDGIDIIKRNLIFKNPNLNFQQKDFLKFKTNNKYDNIITNPPYSIAQKFLEKSMELVKDEGKIALFLKIQFLEGIKRKQMFKKYPPKFIHVFSKRQTPMRNGSAFDANGKKWNNTMCFAWFVWEKGNEEFPIIKWI